MNVRNPRRSIEAGLSIVLLLASTGCGLALAEPVSLYVSPVGNDAAAGTSPVYSQTWQ